MRQETPSTTRWWTASSSRGAGRPVNRRAASSGPASSRKAACAAAVTLASSSGAAASSRPPRSCVRSSSGSSPGAAHHCVQEPSPCRVKRERRASWWSHRARSARCRASGSTSAGVSTTTHWSKISGRRGAASRNQCWTGVRPTSPVTGEVPATVVAPCAAVAAARAATVGYRNRSRGVSVSPAVRARETTWMPRIESPPSMKKLSSAPTRSTPSRSAQMPARIRSAPSRGSR